MIITSCTRYVLYHPASKHFFSNRSLEKASEKSNYGFLTSSLDKALKLECLEWAKNGLKNLKDSCSYLIVARNPMFIEAYKRIKLPGELVVNPKHLEIKEILIEFRFKE